ncbi:MAG: YbaN family protein [Prevotellaceae bacterium]|jgi:uncharacterized membrane protein YbaN (DUF454 family)|nr:YbaN family protein [Prevotellaceae bacterium]
MAGSISLGLGILGIFLPLLPTTPFLPLTLFCYARSSERLYYRVLNDKYLGKYLHEYLEKRGIRLHIKIYIITLLWIGIGSCILFVVNPLWLKLLLFAIALGVSIHILSFKTLKKNG